MDALEAIRARRSIRQYQSKPIPKEVIEQIVDCGRWAPTAMNQQPWKFVVVTDEAMRTQIADITDYGKFIAQAPACVAVFCEDTMYYLEDGCAAVENILLGATALGVGSCWVAGDKKKYCEEVTRLLDVPSGYKLIALIALGYAAQPGRARKKSLDEVLCWEKW
ncbi:MAG: nitroreductase family protein [Deltaproteobacteria bacterium]|nr:nitroreductase family protein [Deltaproteobacteria bacterium]